MARGECGFHVAMADESRLGRLGGRRLAGDVYYQWPVADFSAAINQCQRNILPAHEMIGLTTSILSRSEASSLSENRNS
jgi:predicted alpha/beta hydrolase